MPRNSRHARALGLERRDLVVHLGAVIEVVVIAARGRKHEPDAVAADAVVAREQGDVADRADFAPRIGAALHAHDDFHDVAWESPQHSVVRVIHQMTVNRHDDETVRVMGNAVHLAEDSGHRVGAEIDVAMTARVTSSRTGYRCTSVEAPRWDPVHDRDLRAVLNLGTAGRANRPERERKPSTRNAESKQRSPHRTYLLPSIIPQGSEAPGMLPRRAQEKSQGCANSQ